MKHILTSAFLAIFSAMTSFASTADYNIVPKPHSIVMLPGHGVELDSDFAIIYPDGNEKLKRNAVLLSEYIHGLTGLDLKLSAGNACGSKVIILTDTLTDSNPEAYRLSVDNLAIRIDGASAAGNFYGIQTLRKSIDADHGENVCFPAVRIYDAPRFPYRGAHLDVSRHFFPADSVKKFIDVMALHNVNRFHWHLTDDQGWRLEIKKYPRLTQIGATRRGFHIRSNPDEADTLSYSGHYSQDEVRDIVKYAADRHVTVVPEIDMPGHMLAVLASYPELGCTGGPYRVWTRGGISDDVLCAGNDASIRFIDDVLAEVVALFPSEYIHIGGDECPTVRWKECARCQQRIRQAGLRDDSLSTAEQKLQNYVMAHASATLASHGRRMIGWDEIIDGGLFPGSTVMSWRGTEGAVKASAMGHDAILTPATICYFTASQTENRDGEPYGAGGFLPVRKVYEFEPTAGVAPEARRHIIGTQSCLWSEGLLDLPQALYQALPRMAALAEVQWSDPAHKDYNNFAARLTGLCDHYRRLGLPFGTHIFDVQGSLEADSAKGSLMLTMRTADNHPIRYTLDGTMPTPQSPVYDSPLTIDSSTVVTARVFRTSGESRLYTDSVTFGKSTFRHIDLLTSPAHKYTVPPMTLVDGLFGGNGFDTGRWMGFEGTPLIATIDLSKTDTVSGVDLRTFVSTSTWIFDTDKIKVELSADGNKFTTVYDNAFKMPEAHESGIRLHSIVFSPTKARFVRVTAGCVTEIPLWHTAGKGKPAFLFVDEIMVK